MNLHYFKKYKLLKKYYLLFINYQHTLSDFNMLFRYFFTSGKFLAIEIGSSITMFLF